MKGVEHMQRLTRINRIIELAGKLKKPAIKKRAEATKQDMIQSVVERKLIQLVWRNALGWKQINGLAVSGAIKRSLRLLYLCCNCQYKRAEKEMHERFSELQLLLEDEGMDASVMAQVLYYDFIRDISLTSLDDFFASHGITEYMLDKTTKTKAAGIYDNLYEIYRKGMGDDAGV